MDFALEGKTALVTGASGGLGFAAAMALVNEGAELYLNGRDKNRLEQAAEKIIAKTSVIPKQIVADVSTIEGIEYIGEVTGGAVDILVSNAGGPPPGDISDHDEPTWLAAHDLTLRSAQRLSSLFLPNMKQHSWGRLVYITSIGVLQPVNELILSNTYRAAVTGMAKTLSNNYARYGITVNCVCPGYTQTERLESLMKNRADQNNVSIDKAKGAVTDNIPAGRFGQPEELAALIAFLASDKAAYITGCSIPVDGGVNSGLL